MTHSRLLRAAVSLLLALCGATSAAQPSPPVEPPVVQGSTEVPYPVGAHGDAVVVLGLVVDVDGSVSEVTVEQGAPPFAEQARRAVQAWHFVPARRGDAPVAVRIHARVEFRQASPPPAPVLAAPPKPPAPPAELSLGTVVRGERIEPGQLTLKADEIRQLPGAFGDPFRAIEVLPGVAPLVSGIPYFFVRGAPPNDNGYVLDGIRVPLLFHIGIGEGVIHPALLDRVDLFPGAAPASQGGVVGGVIAAQTAAPAAAPHGEVELRLLDVGGLAETPFDEGRGTVLVAARYGYPGLVLSLVSPDVRLGYWDYQARATWKLTDRDTVGIFAFGSHDLLENRDQRTGAFVEQLASDFHRVDLREDHAFEHGHLRVAVTGGVDGQGGSLGGDQAAPANVVDHPVAARVELEQTLSARVHLRGGASAQYDAYGFNESAASEVEAPVPSTADPPPTNFTWGAHADVVWRVVPRLELVPGLRFDVYQSSRPVVVDASARVHTTVPALEPRLSARVSLGERVASITAVGLAHQLPALRVGAILGPILTVPGFPYGDSQLQTALQTSQGIELSLPGEVVLTASGFWTRFSGLTDLTAACLQPTPASGPGMPASAPFVCPDNAPVPGHAYGLEVLVRRSLSKRLSGWLSYTLSRSMRVAHFVTLSGAQAVATVPSEGDHTHVLNAALAYELGRRWRLGGRFVFFSGSPYSNLSGNVPVPPYNGQRYPPFFRLDVRAEKSWPLGESGKLALILEVQNATLSTEVYGLSCDGIETNVETRLTCTPSRFGPLTIPSVGLEATF